MGYKVGLTEAACRDLGAVVCFLANKNPEAGLRAGYEILDVIFALSIMPRRGASVRQRPGLRKLSHRYYLIFYQVNESEQWVEVVRIWDGRQNPAKLQLP